ncbi:hypothetical protein AGLY_000795 [Aphis glycines]|uniref:Uncharacterized protein n=1 Tax=Aphis glycines TaxID=307491 RepID=A0A6G0UAC8_APHGL|nr:hypothetical protein AGLY_000795 [Aphis glycines]
MDMRTSVSLGLSGGVNEAVEFWLNGCFMAIHRCILLGWIWLVLNSFVRRDKFLIFHWFHFNVIWRSVCHKIIKYWKIHNIEEQFKYSNNFPAMSLLVSLSHSVSFKLHIALEDRAAVGSLLKSNELLGCTTCDIPDIFVFSHNKPLGDTPLTYVNGSDVLRHRYRPCAGTRTHADTKKLCRQAEARRFDLLFAIVITVTSPTDYYLYYRRAGGPDVDRGVCNLYPYYYNTTL